MNKIINKFLSTGEKALCQNCIYDSQDLFIEFVDHLLNIVEEFTIYRDNKFKIFI